MIPVRDAVEVLLERSGRFQAKHVVQLTGRSRQVVHRHLRRLVESRELKMWGERRGTWFEPGPAHSGGLLVLHPSEDVDGKFWHSYLQDAKQTGYVRLIRFGHRLHTRAMAQLAFRRLLWSRSHTFVDFDGVTSITEAFANAMFDVASYSYGYMLPINANPDVRRVIERAERCQRFRVWSEYGT